MVLSIIQTKGFVTCNVENEYITVSEAAQLAGVTDRSIRRLASGASGQTSGRAGLPVIKQDTQKKPYKLLILREFLVTYYKIAENTSEIRPDAPDAKRLKIDQSPDAKEPNSPPRPDAPDAVRVELERIILAKEETIFILRNELDQLHKTLERKDVLLQNAINTLQRLESSTMTESHTPPTNDPPRTRKPANTGSPAQSWWLIVAIIVGLMALFWVASL